MKAKAQPKELLKDKTPVTARRSKCDYLTSITKGLQMKRPILMFVCKDGTLTYGPRGKKPFNGVALPVFSVDTMLEANYLQVTLCRRQYAKHPLLPSQPWYVLTRFDGNVESLDGVAQEMASVMERLGLCRQQTRVAGKVVNLPVITEVKA